MKKLMQSCALVALVLGAASAANAQTINFDDLSSYGDPIANGYGGVNWDNFFTVGWEQYGGLDGTGYQTGTVSSPNVAYNAYGYPASISAISSSGFTLTSADFTAAWGDQWVYVNGTQVGGGVLSDSFWTTTSGPVLHTFNWTNVASVTFSTSYAQLAMDNLTLTPSGAVPEPASWALMLGGFGLVGGAMRMRKRTVSFA
jgi:hypothetical protein